MEFYLKIFKWHFKATLRKCLRKIFYNVEYYKDTFKPRTGSYRVRTDQIEKIYVWKKTDLSMLEKIKYKYLFSIKWKSLIDVFETLMIIQLHPFRKLDNGMVVEGEWETTEYLMRLEDTLLYKAACDRYKWGRSWTKTDYYNDYLSSRRSRSRSCKLDIIEWEKLFFKMKKNGYISQQELNNVSCPHCKFRNAQLGICSRCNHKIDFTNAIKNYINHLQLGEIAIHIGKHGDLYLSQGRHRLTFANLLNIEYVYVNIIVRHKQWVTFRESIIKQVNEKGGYVHYPLTHVDLQHIPSRYGHDVYQIIMHNLDLKTGKILVIRAHWGYFCHKFEALGYECYAYEPDETAFDILIKLKRAERKFFKLIEGTIEESISGPKDIEIIIATGRIDDLRQDFEEQGPFIDRINVRVIFLHLHSVNKNESEELLEFVSHKFVQSDWQKIGSAIDGTPIYRININ